MIQMVKARPQSITKPIRRSDVVRVVSQPKKLRTPIDLTLADIAKLLCDYAKDKVAADSKGDKRHESANHGFNVLSALASTEGVTLGTSAIKGLLSSNPTQNPRMGSTLKPIAELLQRWKIIDPNTGQRVLFSANELKQIHERTYSKLLDGRAALRVEIEGLLQGANEWQLFVVSQFLKGNSTQAQITQFLQKEKEQFLGTMDIDLEALIAGDDSDYVAGRVHVIMLNDKTCVGISNNEEYVRSLINESSIEKSQIPEEELNLRVRALAKVADSIEDNKFDLDDIEASKEMIVLIALYAEKPYKESNIEGAEGNLARIKQFFEWLRLPSPENRI